ncbi:MAG: hypothetical protein R3F35_19455 [Myxococcota bacterium]
MSNFDEALERFHRVDFEYADGLASHGPMAAQALVDLGHPALIPAFVDRYVPRLPPARPGRVLRADERDAARGDFERAPDWVATFEDALGRGEVGAVLRETLPGLLPGVFAAAGHGLLRTVHALRALEQEDGPLRRGELARGLAYWTARFATLPGRPGAAARPLGASGAPDRLTRLDEVRRLDPAPPPGETLVAASARLAGHASFRAVVEALPLPAAEEVDDFLARLVRAGARLYLARPAARIAFAHAITIPAAARWLARRLSEGTDRVRLAGAAFQAVAALQAMHGGPAAPEPADVEVRQAVENWDEIRYRAACSLEEHAIKVAEACRREDRERPHPDLRLAAADAALRLDGSRSAVRC